MKFPFFVAPEVLSPCEYSFPSDVFSFAMVAWETISSDTISKVPENPFIQGDASEVYSKVILVNLRTLICFFTLFSSFFA